MGLRPGEGRDSIHGRDATLPRARPQRAIPSRFPTEPTLTTAVLDATSDDFAQRLFLRALRRKSLDKLALRGLMNSIPTVGASKEVRLVPIKGVVPDLRRIPPGCGFEPRCPEAMDICKREHPPLITVVEGHKASCWLYHSANMKEGADAE